MVYVVLLQSLGLVLCALTLLMRLLAVPSPVVGAGQHTDFAARFVEFFAAAVDETLLLPAGRQGLASIPLPFREYQDPYRTVAELTAAIEQMAAKPELEHVPHLIKALYQLQHALGRSPDDLAACLDCQCARLTTGSFAGKRVGRVERIAVGALLNQRVMMPLNNGTHVKQPFGIAIFDTEDRVLSKAKVLCS